jgi:hypothetical protein
MGEKDDEKEDSLESDDGYINGSALAFTRLWLFDSRLRTTERRDGT